MRKMENGKFYEKAIKRVAHLNASNLSETKFVLALEDEDEDEDEGE